MPQHVVVNFGHDVVPILAVDVADVGGVDLVLVLDAGYEARHGRRNEVQRRVHFFSLLKNI